MNKIFVIAWREYLSVVKSKAFVVGLILLPVMMFAPGLIERQASKVVDTKDRLFAVVDRTDGQRVFEALKSAADKRNTERIFDPQTRKQVQPKFVLERVTPETTDAKVWEQRLALGDRVRTGSLFAIVEVGEKSLEPTTRPAGSGSGASGEASGAASGGASVGATAGGSTGADDSRVIRYQSNAPTYTQFRDLLVETVQQTVRSERLATAGMAPEAFRRIIAPVSVEDRGLTRRESSGAITDNAPKNRMLSFFISFGLVLLMFMIVLTGAIPLMQGTLEEKQNRIAEILLGSVSPFQLMAGKVLGMVGTSMTLVAVYLIGGLYMLSRMAGEQYMPSGPVIVWFMVFTLLAVLMFGSLYIAIGAACTDAKEVQSLIMPVNILLIVPLWLTATVINNPTGPIAKVATYFPPATPMISIARISIPPGMPTLEIVIAVLVVLLTTVALIWASGKVFRIGILMQGKGASLGQMFRWITQR